MTDMLSLLFTLYNIYVHTHTYIYHIYIYIQTQAGEEINQVYQLERTISILEKNVNWKASQEITTKLS